MAKKKSYTSQLREMEVGDELTFPFRKILSLNAIRTRVQDETGFKYSVISKGNNVVTVIRNK